MITQDMLPMVAMPSMNDIHLEELIIINKISEAIEQKNIETLDALLEEMLAHTIEHFVFEEEMMREKQFPAYEIHKGEHDRVLGEFRQVITAWKKDRDLDILANYVNVILPSWMIQHIQTMDKVTAIFLTKGTMSTLNAL